MAAQDGVLHTRKYLAEVAGQSCTTLCRACGQEPESVGHILSACTAQLFHLIKWRYDRMLYVLVRAVMGLGLPKELLAPGGVAQAGVYGTETEAVKVDMKCPTMEATQACRPDLVLRDRKIYIFDVSCPWEGGKREREIPQVSAPGSRPCCPMEGTGGSDPRCNRSPWNEQEG